MSSENQSVFFAVIAWFLMQFAGGANAQGRQGFAASVGVGVSQVKDRDDLETFSANDIGYILGAEYRFNEHFALGLNSSSPGGPEDEFNSVDFRLAGRYFDGPKDESGAPVTVGFNYRF